MEKAFESVSETSMPFVYTKRRHFIRNRKLLQDINFINQTKKTITDQDMKMFTKDSNNNPINQAIYNWILFHKQDIRVVDAGSGHIGEKGFYMDTNYEYDCLMCFLYYYEPEGSFMVRTPHPDIMNQFMILNFKISSFELFHNVKPEIVTKVLNKLVEQCAFIPLIICREDSAVIINDRLCWDKVVTSGEAILGHRTLLQRLMASGYKMKRFDPKKNYYIIGDGSTLWLEREDRIKANARRSGMAGTTPK